MTGCVKSLLAGAALGVLFILDRREQAEKNKARAAKAKHFADVGAQNRAKAHPLRLICLGAPVAGHVTARLGQVVDKAAGWVVT